MSSTSKNILIIDDHRLFTDGLSLILSRLPGGANVSIFSSVRAALANPSMIESQDIILLDLHMPSIDGFGFLQSLNERGIRADVVVVSSTEKLSDIEFALKLGAKGFIPKYASSDEMLNGVLAVQRGELYVPEHLVGAIRWPERVFFGRQETETIKDNATQSTMIRPRQMDVLKLMHEGRSNTDIALILGVSESAIKGHVSILFKTLNVKNRTACVRVAIEKDLIKA